MARSNALYRSLDLIVGVPLLVLAAVFRSRRQIPTDPQRIGVLSPTAIGDLILETGVLLRIRKRYPSAAIHLFHGPSNAGIVPLLTVDVQTHCINFTNLRETFATIRSAQLDLLIDLCPWPRLTALYAAFSGATTVGFHADRQYRHYAFDVSVPHKRFRHESENLHELAEVFAHCGEYKIELRSDFPKSTMNLPYEQLILCHITAGGSQAQSKSWPISSWVALTRQLTAAGFSIGFTGTAADNKAIAGVLAKAELPPDKAFSLCGKLSLSDLADTLTRSRLLITVDTGVLHLASALDVPLVALHGPTHSSRWGARSIRAVNLNAPHKAGGFIHFGFETNSAAQEVMATLSVESVYEAAITALSR